MGAVGQDHKNIVELLIQHGADINQYCGLYQVSPLIQTARNRNIDDIAKILIKSDATVNYENPMQEAALTICLEE